MALRQDISGAGRVVFNLLSQLIDDNAQIFALVAVERPPNGSKQIFVPDRSTSMLHQATEGLVFFWSETYLLTLFFHEPAIGVERDVTDYADQLWSSNRSLATPDDSS